MEKIKNFVKKHEEGIVTAAIIIGCTAASYAAMYIATSQWPPVSMIETAQEGSLVRLTYSNGKQEIFDLT